LIFFTLQNEFQSFCIVAERPKLGLIVTVAAGLTNIVLDALFVAAFRWGIVGAAVATAASQVVGGVIPLVYFSLPNGSLLRLGRCAWDPRALWQTCFNGSSELVTSLSMSLVNMLYNLQLMKLAGENGVAAYGVIMYVNFIFVGVFLGYSLGVAPVVSFHYGAMNYDELKNLRRRSMVLVTVLAVSLTAAALALSAPLARIFVGYDGELMAMTRRGFAIYAVSFLIMGYNMFASSFFTALNNGFISALISFSRALLFQAVAILLLPRFWGVDGVWAAVVAAELASLAVTIVCLLSKKKEYHY
jgi:Na+-driven multidrug efflux pump